MRIELIKKHIVAFSMGLVLAVSAVTTIPTNVYALDFTQDANGNLLAEDEEKFFYMVPAGTEMTGECGLILYGGNKPDIVLPKYCDNFKVTKVFSDFTSIFPLLPMKSFQTVKIPSGYKSIESDAGGKVGAFQNQKDLYRIEIPKSVTDIGAHAFDGCDKTKLTFVAPKGSYARLYAISHEFFYTDSKKQAVNLFGNMMVVGEEKQIAVYNTNKKVSYTSSEPSVCAVGKNGKLVAKKAGTVKITVKVSKKTYSFSVTVKKRTKANVLKTIWENYVTEGMTDEEKKAAAKVWLDNHVTISGTNNTLNAAFVNGKASKSGYKKAYKEILAHYGL